MKNITKAHHLLYLVEGMEEDYQQREMNELSFGQKRAIAPNWAQKSVAGVKLGGGDDTGTFGSFHYDDAKNVTPVKKVAAKVVQPVINVNVGPRQYRKQLHQFEAPWGGEGGVAPDAQHAARTLPGIHTQHTDLATELSEPPVNVPYGSEPRGGIGTLHGFGRSSVSRPKLLKQKYLDIAQHKDTSLVPPTTGVIVPTQSEMVHLLTVAGDVSVDPETVGQKFVYLLTQGGVAGKHALLNVLHWAKDIGARALSNLGFTLKNFLLLRDSKQRLLATIDRELHGHPDHDKLYEAAKLAIDQLTREVQQFVDDEKYKLQRKLADEKRGANVRFTSLKQRIQAEYKGYKRTLPQAVKGAAASREAEINAVRAGAAAGLPFVKSETEQLAELGKIYSEMATLTRKVMPHGIGGGTRLEKTKSGGGLGSIVAHFQDPNALTDFQNAEIEAQSSQAALRAAVSSGIIGQIQTALASLGTANRALHDALGRLNTRAYPKEEARLQQLSAQASYILKDMEKKVSRGELVSVMNKKYDQEKAHLAALTAGTTQAVLAKLKAKRDKDMNTLRAQRATDYARMSAYRTETQRATKEKARGYSALRLHDLAREIQASSPGTPDLSYAI